MSEPRVIWECPDERCGWVQDVEGLCPRGYGPTPGHGLCQRLEVVPKAELDATLRDMEEAISAEQNLARRLTEAQAERDKYEQEAVMQARWKGDAFDERDRAEEQFSAAHSQLLDALDALEGVVRVADRETKEFRAARAVLAKHGRG